MKVSERGCQRQRISSETVKSSQVKTMSRPTTVKHSSGAQDHIFIMSDTCGFIDVDVLASTVILESESHGSHDHILLCQIRDSTNLEVHIPIFMSISPQICVAQSYRRALSSLLVASCDSQGYGRGIRDICLGLDCLENSTSILACIFVPWEGVYQAVGHQRPSLPVISRYIT
jgi:hypothetical protein